MPDSTLDQGDLARAALRVFADYADPRRRAPADLQITSGSRLAKRQLTMGDCYAAADALANHDTPAPLAEPGVRDAVEARETIRHGIFQARGALRLDTMADATGAPYGTTVAALEALDAAAAALARLDPATRGVETRAGGIELPPNRANWRAAEAKIAAGIEALIRQNAKLCGVKVYPTQHPGGRGIDHALFLARAIQDGSHGLADDPIKTASWRGSLQTMLYDSLRLSTLDAERARTREAYEAGSRKCQWAGGNDISYCITCGAEHDYRKSDRPACPLATPQDAEATVRGVEVPAGWQLVPKVPTEEMLFADIGLRPGNAHYDAIASKSAHSYRLMLAAAPSEPETGTGGDWQPIETAPKDDQRILLHHKLWPSPPVVCGSWNSGGKWVSANLPYGFPQPTHWQPLPAPPSSTIAPRPAETRGPSEGDGSQGATVGVPESVWCFDMDAAPHDQPVHIVNDRGSFIAEWEEGWMTDGSGWWLISDGKDYERPLRGEEPRAWRRVGKLPGRSAVPTPSNTVATPLDPASTPADPTALDKPCISARDAFPDRKGDWMQTFTGRRFWPLDPRPEDICIEDIAHALSLQTRYGGHCLRFYSVAEHCVRLARAASPETALWLLLHDASEAYLSDMVRPLKRHMPEYRAAEDRVAWAVYEAFGMDPGLEPAEVKALDNRSRSVSRAPRSALVPGTS